MTPPTSRDGRVRALYAMAAAGLDIGSFVVQAVWLLCVVGLTVFVVTIVAAIFHAIV